MEFLWWYWAAFGFLLIVAELFVPGFVLIWFGLGGFLVALVLGLVPALALNAQLLIWTLSSVAMTGVWFLAFRPSRQKTLIGRASAQLIGEVGILVTEVAPFKQGRVRFQKPIVGSDVWECRADEEIPAGSRVRLEAVEGSFVSVSKVKG